MLAATEHIVESSDLVSIDPSTGREVWRGRVSDVDDLVSRAQRAWPTWAALPLTNRIELMRRFANEVRKEHDKLVTAITPCGLWRTAIVPWSAVSNLRCAVRSA